jgi:copper chaperone CopZ
MICAHAVSVALKGFAGVESVDVSLNKGLATVKLKPGNSVRPEELWETIRRNGFTPRETRVVVRGVVEGMKLKVSSASQTYDLAADSDMPKAMDEVAKQSGNKVTIEGRLVPPKGFKSHVPLLVHGVVDQRK